MATLMAIFLAAHLTCVCAGPALATAMAVPSGAPVRTADPHACCHRTGDAAPTPAQHQPRVCQHCTHAQLTAPDGVKLTGPPASVLPAFLAPATAASALTPSHARRCGLRAGDGHAPPPDQLRTRVLQL